MDNDGNLVAFDNPAFGSIAVLQQPVTSIVVSGLSSISLLKQQAVYTAQVLPDYATNKAVNWSVSNITVASIDANGLLTPITNATFYVDCFGYISWVRNISFGNIKNGLLANVSFYGLGLSIAADAKFLDLKTKTEFTVTLDSNNLTALCG